MFKIILKEELATIIFKQREKKGLKHEECWNLGHVFFQFSALSMCAAFGSLENGALVFLNKILSE